MGLDFERVAVGDHEIRELAFLDASHLICYSPDLRSIDGDCFDRLFLWQSEWYRRRGLVRQIAGELITEAREREFDSCLVELTWRGERLVVEIVLVQRKCESRPKDYGYISLLDFIKPLVCLFGLAEDDADLLFIGKLQSVANGALALCRNEQRLLSSNHWQHRFEPEIGFEPSLAGRLG